MDRSGINFILPLVFQECEDEFKSELVNDCLIPAQNFQLAVDGAGCELPAVADDVQYVSDKPWNLNRCKAREISSLPLPLSPASNTL